jgi:hypothetical protein
MSPDPAMGIALGSVAALIALPAFGAWRRRELSREASRVAQQLQAFAFGARREVERVPLGDELVASLARLRRGVPEIVAFLLTQQLPRLTPALQADAAQRLALRLLRRVAFERKMLARSASGLKRGAAAAALPPLVVIAMTLLDAQPPLLALALLIALESLGCWLLWRTARVEV